MTIENVDIDSLKGQLAPAILEWLAEDELPTSWLFSSYTNMGEFSKSSPEEELAELERCLLKAAATTVQVNSRQAAMEELKHFIEKNSNLNIKHISTWLNRYEKWVEHKGSPH